MKFYLKSIGCALCLLPLGCTTHYYYPAYESGLEMQGSSSRLQPSLSLKDKKIQLSCERLDAGGRDVVDNDLCRKVGSWIEASQGEVAVEPTADEAGASEAADLYLHVRSSTLAKNPPGLESFFMVASLGFYPTQTDRWCTIELTIADSQQKTLSSGTFKALFRTYFGWAYFLFARVQGLWQKPVTYRATLENSQDFYLYLGALMRDAQLIDGSDGEAAP